MATVDGKTSIKIDELVNGSIISGTIDPTSGHLLLTNRGGAVIDAGLVTKPFGASWSNTAPYTNGDVVGYAGYLWKALGTNTGKPPALFTSLWTRLTGTDMTDWVERDAYFTGDTLSESWELFWKSGTVTSSFSTVAGEFETGLRSLKLAMSATSFQRMYYKEENLVRGGEQVVVTVRAKLLSAAAGVTVDAELLQNDATSTPSPLATGLSTTASSEGAQTLTTSWATYRFTLTAVNAKPRANANVMFQTGANAAVVLVDRIRITKVTTPSFKAPNVQVFAASGTWTKPAGAKTVTVEVVAGGGGGGSAAAAGSGAHAKGGGGGAGASSSLTTSADALAATVAVTVGAGGGNNAAGGTSSFGAHAVAGGGSAGTSGTSSTATWGVNGGLGGTASAGDLQLPGEVGGYGFGGGSLGVGGYGASGKHGSGGRGGQSGAAAASVVGGAASGYGAGGGGGLSTSTGAAANGGAGSDGVVVVTTYFQ